MKVEALLLLAIGTFFAIIGVIYWFTSYEQAGTMMLIGTATFGILPGSYYYFWHRRMKPRTEDRQDATIEDGAGVIDSFPGSSIWPFIFGMGALTMVLSMVFGLWLTFPGAAVILIAVIGFTAESRRGGNV